MKYLELKLQLLWSFLFIHFIMFMFSPRTPMSQEKNFSQAQEGAEIATDNKNSERNFINTEMRLTSRNQRISWHSVHWSGCPLLALILWWGADVLVGHEQKQVVNPPIYVRFRVKREHGQKSFCGLSFALLLIHDKGTFSSFLSFLTFHCLLQHQYVLTDNCDAISLLVNEKETKARKAKPIILAYKTMP